MLRLVLELAVGELGRVRERVAGRFARAEPRAGRGSDGEDWERRQPGAQATRLGHTHNVEPASDDAVFESVQALVTAGEYLDDIPGIAAASSPGSGQYLRSAGGRYRRIYQRGTPEYRQARRAGLLERLPALRPAPADAVEEAENLIGYRLPPLLRRLYLEAGNGGFGPGYGILGLRDGHRDDTRRAALDLYREAHDTSSPHWSFLPASLLPICYWGCGIYSFTDCSQPQGPMWGWDPNPGPVDRQALFAQPSPWPNGSTDGSAASSASQPWCTILTRSNGAVRLSKSTHSG
jgi:hypothetical protein